MSSTIVTNQPVPNAAATIVYPGESGTPSMRVLLFTSISGVYLNGREARMVASRLIRAAQRIGRRTPSK